MVDAEVRGDRADLPMLAEIEPANLGVLLGRDHQAPSSTRAGAATRAAPPNGSSDRTRRSTAGRGATATPRAHRWQGVSRLRQARRKSDPSRGGVRDTRAGGRDDRGGLLGWPGVTMTILVIIVLVLLLGGGGGLGVGVGTILLILLVVYLLGGLR
jgi:Flp pilus assembly protein TadB